MAVGFFSSIRSSYIDEARPTADALVVAINQALGSLGLPPYTDPIVAPDVYVGNKFGRSSLDHHSARCLSELAQLGSDLPHLGLLTHPYRVVFLPLEFPRPLETGHRERLVAAEVPIWVGSARRLLAELHALAPRLSIVFDGDLDDDLAARIDGLEALSASDSQTMIEDTRTAWLVLYEGARLSVTHDTALSLAG